MQNKACNLSVFYKTLRVDKTVALRQIKLHCIWNKKRKKQEKNDFNANKKEAEIFPNKILLLNEAAFFFNILFYGGIILLSQ